VEVEVSKTYPVSGKLKKKITISVGTQESAYRILLSAPFLSIGDRKALMQAIVTGPETTWIRLAFKNGLLPDQTAEHRMSIERFLAGSGAENAMLVLKSGQRAHIRKLAIRRLCEKPRSASQALLSQYLTFDASEEAILVDALLPALTGLQAYRLLTKHLFKGLQPLKVVGHRRLKIIEMLGKCEYSTTTAAQLLLAQGSKRERKFVPTFTLEERIVLLSYAIKYNGWAGSLLYPNWDDENPELTEEERKRLAPEALSYYREKLANSRFVDKKKLAEARKLLDEFGDFYSKEVANEFRSFLETLAQQAA
jgi:hypothetical protein